MLGFVIAMLAVMAMIDRWRHLPAVRPLRRMLVDTPAAWLNGLTRKHLIFGALMLAVVLVGGEMLAALGPLDMPLILLCDVSAFIDVAVVTITLAASARITGGWRMLVGQRPLRARSRRARAHRRPAAPRGDNDEDDGPLRLAA